MDQSKVVLITGCSSGFGRLMAEKLAGLGHRVFASMRAVHAKNAPVRAELEQLAQQQCLPIEVIELDVRDPQSVDKAVAELMARAGRIDVAINNAGQGCLGITEAFTVEQVQTLFDTNFFGVIRVNRAVLPHMRRQKSGLLIHITSEIGRVLMPLLGPYCASKFALEALAEAYHHDLAPLGIDSIIVEPGAYPTEIGNNGQLPADRARQDEYGFARQRIEQLVQSFGNYLGRPDVPRPQEVADAIAHLIALPAGQRPLRTLIGPEAQRLQGFNQMAATGQRDILKHLGMDYLLAQPGIAP